MYDCNRCSGIRVLVLFSLVIDSYSPVCDNSVCVKFADDVTILHFIREEEEDLQQEWKNIEVWSHSHGLRLNQETSCVMNYVTKRSLIFVNVTSNDGSILSTVSSLCLLGVIISCDFTWNVHVHKVVNKCYKRFYILRNLRRTGCPPALVHKCYVAFIRSILLYSFPCFCNLPQYLFDRMLRVEDRAARYFPEHDFCKIPDTVDRICNRLFNSVLNSSDHPLRVLFESRSPTRRNACVLRAPRTKTTRLFNSFIRYGRF